MSFGQPSWLLLAVPVLVLWAAFFRGWSRLRWLAWLLLCVLALADPRRDAARGTHGHVVLLVDRSASVRGEALARALTLAPELSRYAQARGGALHVLGFGRNASVLAGPGEPLEALRGLAVQDASDLTAGLQLAAAQPGVSDVVLVSDGVYTSEDPLPVAVELRQQGVRVHTLQVDTHAPADAAITRLLAPPRVPRGQPFSIAVEIDSRIAQSGQLRVRDASGALVFERTLQLTAGTRRYALRLDASELGVHKLDATLDVAADTSPGNNRAQTLVESVGQPQVVVYTHNPDSALVRALGSAQLQLAVRSHGEALSLSAISGSAAVVLENMSLNELGDAADAALDSYVRKLGGGLLITGGQNSYALGGYYRSQLEQLLPVSMEQKDELRRPRLDMAIALDRSGSMSVVLSDGSQKMDLANRGAAEAIALLAPGDAISVFAVDTAAHNVVPLQRIVDAVHKRKLIESVRAIESTGGGIYVNTALSAAMDALLKGSAPTRHIVLFADAADAEEPGNYAELVKSFRRAGGTLSVIGLGTESDSDAALLREIAELGGGRVYFTADALQLPRVFAQDVMRVARKTFLRTRTTVEPARGLLALQLPLTAAPAVAGYNATYLVPGAEPSLITGDEQHAPLAAAWQRGAGKVMAVTFEADGPDTGEIANWAEYKPFFRAAVEWIKRASADIDLDATLKLEGNQALLRVELPEGHHTTSAPAAWLFSDDTQAPRPLRLAWTGPNTLSAYGPIDSGHAYQAAVVLPGQPALTLPWTMQPYSPEFAARSGPRTGDAVLGALAQATHGGVYTRPEDLGRPRTQPQQAPSSLVGLIVIAMLVLLLADIAWRRGLMSGRWLAWRRTWLQPMAAQFRRRVRSRVLATPAVNAPAAPAAEEQPSTEDAPEAASALSEAKRRARQRQGR
jgi:Mg-chelatase subunit ChlD